MNAEKSNKYREATRSVINEVAKKQNIILISWKDYWKLNKEDKEKYLEKYNAVMKAAKPKIAEVEKTVDQVDVSDFVDHIDYLVEKIGINHVGISSDFDGGGGVKGWNDASETLNVTMELVKRGYTEAQIEKLWGMNLLRVLDEVHKVAKELQGV